MTEFTFTGQAAPRLWHGSGPNSEQIARAADILAGAQRPLVFARENARVAGNAAALEAFLERFALSAGGVPLHRQFDRRPTIRCIWASIPCRICTRPT